MATLKYTRDQLVALWRDDYPLPKDFCTTKNSFVMDRPHIPWLCSEHGISNYKMSAETGTKVKVKADIAKPAGISKGDAKKKVSRFDKKKAPQPLQPVLAPSAWYYIDPQGCVQGPYATDKLREWWEGGFLPQDLQISLENDMSKFAPVANFFPDLRLAFLYNPMLFPFMAPPDAEANSPLEEIYLGYINSLTQ